MYKYLSNLVVLLSLTLFLSAGCTPAGEEAGSATGPEQTTKTITTAKDAVPADVGTDVAADAEVDAQTAIESAEEEPCIVTPPEEPVACTMQYDPVCGCDGKTYGNACSARGAGVPRSTPGACENDRLD